MNEKQKEIADYPLENGQASLGDEQKPAGEDLPSNGKNNSVKKGIVILLILLLVVILIVAAFYFFNKGENNSSNEQTGQVNSEIPEAQKNMSEQETGIGEESKSLTEDDKLILQKEIGRSAVPFVTICLDQEGFVEKPGDGVPICRDDKSLAYWSSDGELENLGGSWSGCEMKIGRNPIEFEYCITLSSGQIFKCTEGGCKIDDVMKEDSTSVLEIQNNASDICWDKIEQLGDNRKAREEAVAEIKKLPGVKDAGISADGSVWIEHLSGIEGIISLNPPGTL